MKKYNLESNKEDPILSARPWLADHDHAVHPIKSSADVKDAAASWSLYKEEMSLEQFKLKVTARAKAIGKESSLPKKWKK